MDDQQIEKFNKVGLIITGIVSLYLSGSFFWQIREGAFIDSIPLLLIGVATEIGKYCTLYMVLKNLKQEPRLSAAYSFLLALFVFISLSGSAGSLLMSNKPLSLQQQYIQSRITEISHQIDIETANMKRAGEVNAQTAGVKPARESIQKLTHERESLMLKLDQIPLPGRTMFIVLAEAISAETGWSFEKIHRLQSFSIAALLEVLCILFTCLCYPKKPEEPTLKATPSDSEVKQQPKEDNVRPEREIGILVAKTSVQTSQEQPLSVDMSKYNELVESIRNKKIKPSYDSIRRFMCIQSDRVKYVRSKLLEDNVVKSGPSGTLVIV